MIMNEQTPGESGIASSVGDGHSSKRVELVRKFFSTDLTSDEWVDMFAIDGVKEVPFALPDMTFKWDGRDALQESRRINSRRNWSNVEHLNLEIYPTSDDEVFFVLSQMDARLDDRPYVQNYVHMLQFRNEKIVLYREWFNPLRLLDTRGGTIGFAEGDTFTNPR